MNYTSAINFCQTIGSFFEDGHKVTTAYQPVIIKSDVTPYSSGSEQDSSTALLSKFNLQGIGITALWAQDDQNGDEYVRHRRSHICNRSK